MNRTGQPSFPARPRLAGSFKDQAVQLIKEAICSGEFPAGEIFSHEQLSRWLGISRTPIREALLELQGEGLVAIHRGRGTEVVPVSCREMQEIFEIREALEAKAFTLAIERISGEKLLELQHPFLHYRRQFRLGEPVDYVQVNREFHLSIARASGNSRLYKTIASLLDQPVRTGFYALFMLQRANDSMAEHQGLLGAVEAKNVQKARELIGQHLRRACTALLHALEKTGIAP